MKDLDKEIVDWDVGLKIASFLRVHFDGGEGARVRSFHESQDEA